MRAFSGDQLVISMLGQQPYTACLEAMRHYSHNRTSACPDQIWILEHPPIYTKGKMSQSSDILQTLSYPMVETDRGGQITFHAPGQIIVYLLLHIDSPKSMNNLINLIEQTMINILSRCQICATAHAKHRGVYVDDAKIGSIGIRMRRQNTYHGFSLNVDMDLKPFEAIHPCGRAQAVTHIRDYSQESLTSVYRFCIEEVSKTWGNNRDIFFNY